MHRIVVYIAAVAATSYAAAVSQFRYHSMLGFAGYACLALLNAMCLIWDIKPRMRK